MIGYQLDLKMEGAQSRPCGQSAHDLTHGEFCVVYTTVWPRDRCTGGVPWPCLYSSTRLLQSAQACTSSARSEWLCNMVMLSPMQQIMQQDVQRNAQRTAQRTAQALSRG